MRILQRGWIARSVDDHTPIARCRFLITSRYSDRGNSGSSPCQGYNLITWRRLNLQVCLAPVAPSFPRFETRIPPQQPQNPMEPSGTLPENCPKPLHSLSGPIDPTAFSCWGRTNQKLGCSGNRTNLDRQVAAFFQTLFQKKQSSRLLGKSCNRKGFVARSQKVVMALLVSLKKGPQGPKPGELTTPKR